MCWFGASARIDLWPLRKRLLAHHQPRTFHPSIHMSVHRFVDPSILFVACGLYACRKRNVYTDLWPLWLFFYRRRTRIVRELFTILGLFTYPFVWLFIDSSIHFILSFRVGCTLVEHITSTLTCGRCGFFLRLMHHHCSDKCSAVCVYLFGV